MSNDLHPEIASPTTTPVGYAPMDAVHEEFDALLGAALLGSDDRSREASHDHLADIDAHLAAIAAHLHSHFEAEANWMHETDYPNRDCHLDEHAAVLASAHEVMALDPARRPAVAQAFFRELAGWFPAHSQHLDSALAHWMCKRVHGGKPVVFHMPRRPAG